MSVTVINNTLHVRHVYVLVFLFFLLFLFLLANYKAPPVFLYYYSCFVFFLNHLEVLLQFDLHLDEFFSFKPILLFLELFFLYLITDFHQDIYPLPQMLMHLLTKSFCLDYLVRYKSVGFIFQVDFFHWIERRNRIVWWMLHQLLIHVLSLKMAFNICLLVKNVNIIR